MPKNPQTEDSLLARIAQLSRSPGRPSLSLGIGDDAALFRPKSGHELILTCDWFLEGTHFLRREHPPDSIGWKSLARAVSDIAAMGGAPRCCLMSLALPSTHTGRWLELFLGGLRRASSKFHCVLAGGDTTRRDQILINITVVGEVPSGQAILRSGAGPGEILYVSGRMGEAELGLRILQRCPRLARSHSDLIKKHLYPEPRLALGQWLLRKGFATAMLDLSDGLSSDLPRLCAASSVGAQLQLASLPKTQYLDIALRLRLDPAELALHGGDDYELLFTVPAHKANLLPQRFQGIPLTPVGVITRKRALLLQEKPGPLRPLRPCGWDPFRKKL
jgi:thiamine-monophosphate kinase